MKARRVRGTTASSMLVCSFLAACLAAMMMFTGPASAAGPSRQAPDAGTPVAESPGSDYDVTVPGGDVGAGAATVYQALNRAHGLSATFTASGMRVLPSRAITRDDRSSSSLSTAWLNKSLKAAEKTTN